MNNTKRYTVTSALPYANGPLHIGHIAGAYLPADIYARFLKMQGHDVVFICGSDEHGAAITLRAKKEGITPRDIVDKYHTLNKETFEKFGIEFDLYHRTSAPLHHETASDFFLKLEEKNVFEVQEGEQFFDEEHQQFLADRYITGECPKCGHKNAYGDQCEKCGASLNPTDLINPKSILSGKEPKLKKTKHWYLPMGKQEDWLRDWFDNGDPASWKPHVVGQCKSWVDGGLGSRAMTRDLDWGVKVPVKDAEGKVLYVWLDAPIGYISATKQWAEDNGKNWEDYWKKEGGSELIHFIGKDNIVFHCLIFPILLKLHGDFILPTHVPANGFLNLEGDKLSTSRNWAVWLHEYLEEFPGKEDELRYVLTSIMPENRDSEFTWKDFQARVNNELVAVLGNFVNRVMVLSHKYFDGKILQEVDMSAIPDFDLAKYEADLTKFRFKDALMEAMRLARKGNEFLTQKEPWKRYDKTNPGAAVNHEIAQELHQSTVLIAKLGYYLSPFLPHTSTLIFEMLNINVDVRTTGIDEVLSAIKPGHQLGKPQLLFQKIEDEVVEKQIAKLEANKKANMAEAKQTQKPEAKPEINFDDFLKMELRVGEITQAEKVKKADKLLKLTVDLGFEQRTVVSGIAEHYTPEEVLGKKVSVLLNLQPRKIRGVESQGMILMAETEAGALSFISPEKEMEKGAVIR